MRYNSSFRYDVSENVRTETFPSPVHRLPVLNDVTSHSKFKV